MSQHTAIGMRTQPYSIDYAEAILFECRCAAQSLARKGLKGNPGDPLPDLLSSRAHIRINADPAWFRRLIQQEAEKCA